jgi:alpha-tubulin suppressor-like RCC1 family protein
MVFTWGRGRGGRLGHGDERSRSVPRAVSGLSATNRMGGSGVATASGCGGAPIVMLSCGWNFTAALDECGCVFAFGAAKDGQCGPQRVDSSRPQDHNAAPVRVPGLGPRVMQLATGYHHCLALCRSGDLYSWGRGDQGQVLALYFS